MIDLRSEICVAHDLAFSIFRDLASTDVDFNAGTVGSPRQRKIAGMAQGVRRL